MKYIFKQVDNISGHNTETTIEFDADYVPDILQHFEMFLRGSGFHQSGASEFAGPGSPAAFAAPDHSLRCQLNSDRNPSSDQQH